MTLYIVQPSLSKNATELHTGEKPPFSANQLFTMSLFLQADGDEAARACYLLNRPFTNGVHYFFGSEAQYIIANWSRRR